jgi:tripartite-type tricarboxylate transporter receptor subunit TctC
MFRTIRFIRALLPLTVSVVAAAPLSASAADWPQRPIEIVVPYQAGGGADVMARAFANAARNHLPQSFVVVNKPGAAGVIGWNDVIRSRPDGYKVALTTVEVTFLKDLGLATFTHRDLVPIAKLNADPAVVVVRADAPYQNIEQLLAAARKSSGEIGIGNAGHGSMWHLAAVALAQRGKVKFNEIPFAGGTPALLALLGGHIDAVIASAPEVAPYVLDGKLRALGVMSAERIKGLDHVPTLAEQGIDMQLGTWRGLAVPVGTPDDVIQTLRKTAQQAMLEPELREMMKKQHFTVDTYEDADTFAASMDRENAAIRDIASTLQLQR